MNHPSKNRLDGVLHEHEHDQDEADQRAARRSIREMRGNLRGRLNSARTVAPRLADARFVSVAEFPVRSGTLHVERCGGGLALHYQARGDGPQSRVIIDWRYPPEVLDVLLAELEAAR